MGLQFYYFPQSTATIVHWAIEELGVPVEKIKLDYAAGEHKKPEYLKLNPNGKVPLLVHDGRPIFESLAIMIHLGETFGVDKKLFPAAGLDRATAIQWMVWMQVSVGDAVSRYQRNVSERIPAELRNAKAGEAARLELQNQMKILDDALQGKQWLVGDHFTLADLHLASWVEYFKHFNLDLSPYRNVEAWLARAVDRPSHARAD